MKQYLISVIITTYKRDENVLSRAIKSVLKQSYLHYELIIVDDNNDDLYHENVLRVVKKFSEKKDILLVKHEKNQGAQKARNTGIKNSKGKYIAFLDDDDEWEEDKLELQINEFYNSSLDNLGLVYGWQTEFKELKNGEYEIYKHKSEVDLERISELLLYNNIVGSTSVPLIKKKCFDKVGLFDENLKAKQDYDMWVRICKEFQVSYVERSVCNYYNHLGERISNNPHKKINAELVFLNKHKKEIMKNNKAYGIRKRIIGTYYIQINDFLQARKFLLESFKLYPKDYKTIILLFISLIRYKPKIFGNRI